MADTKNTKDRTIDGMQCTVVLLNPEDSFELQVDLLPAVGAALGAAKGLSSLLLRQEGDAPEMDALAKATAAFAAAMPRERLRAVKRQLLSWATVDNKPLYDQAGKESDTFRGKSLAMWRLLLFAIEVNYPDFFVLFAESAKKAVAAGDSETSPT